MLRSKNTTELVSAILGVIAGVLGILAGMLGILPSCEKKDNVANDDSKPIKIEVASDLKPEIKKLPSSEVPALQPSTASPTTSTDN